MSAFETRRTRRCRPLPFLLVLLLFLTPLLAKEKKREWQVGKLISAETKDAGVVGLPIAGIVVVKNIQWWVYVIETDSLTYELLWRSTKPLNVTVEGRIKFAVAKNGKLFVVDDGGKERKLSVLRKKAKRADP